ncbi:calcium/sodium antiporter [Saccharospirillum mangrovi]|uniref:calcium/sodium antiporter n=1 Tax=Saccharospirillum mangrovi TaxID=2161747 RepID=UPI000D358233|nr:calcium/sodium antiporter [Saccharospirillum mangrovi]
MWLAWLAVIGGLVVLVWSADRFVDGAASTARYAGMSPLLIGMLIVGFGTSAPELVVSVIAASDGNPGLALGNAYGSNITNIGLVVGLVAVIAPIQVQSAIVRRELPILLAVTLFAGWQLLDHELSRLDGFLLLVVFAGTMGWSILQGRQPGDALEAEYSEQLDSHEMTLRASILWLIVGLIGLVLSSRALVWGAVDIASSLGVSDLIIGLTVVAIGTSLPELASSLAAIRKKQHDLALGNVIGSGLFNTLAVVGLASTISPMQTDPAVLSRDWVLMSALTVLLLIMGIGMRQRQGRINRFEGAFLLLIYLAYTTYLVQLALSGG